MCCKGTLLVALSACAIALTQAQSLTTLEARDGVPRTNAEAVKRGLPILKPKSTYRPDGKELYGLLAKHYPCCFFSQHVLVLYPSDKRVQS